MRGTGWKDAERLLLVVDKEGEGDCDKAVTRSRDCRTKLGFGIGTSWVRDNEIVRYQNEARNVLRTNHCRAVNI